MCVKGGVLVAAFLCSCGSVYMCGCTSVEEHHSACYFPFSTTYVRTYVLDVRIV